MRDLLRLTRITVDLNRITQQSQRAGETSSSRGRWEAPAADRPTPEPSVNPLSEEAYRAVRNALRNDPPLAPADAESSTEPIESVPQDVTQEAQQNTPEPIQPQLTAPDRAYPHPGRVADSSQPCHPPGVALTSYSNDFDSHDIGVSQDTEQAEVA